MNIRLVLLISALLISPGCLASQEDSPAYERQAAISSQQAGSYSQRATLDALVDEAGARRYSDTFAPGHELEFSVYVPETQDMSTPAGLMVYVSPIASGSIPDTWREIFERHKLIWVSVNQSGNTMAAERRIVEAKLSVAFISRYYNIDEQRIFVSGMSGGAQIATIAAFLYPDLFKGGLFFCGVNPWSERDPDPWAQNPPEKLSVIQQNRYVFLSGTEDFKLAAIARAYRLYKKAGIENSKLIVIDNMGHELPGARDLDSALGFLDAGKPQLDTPDKHR